MYKNEIVVKSSGGIGVLGLLGVVFVTLKLCNVIDWSWWWVTCPFWLVPAIVITVLFIILLIGIVCVLFGVDKK